MSTNAPYVVSANGVVEPMQTVSVTSQAAGILTAVNFHEGDDVQSGQILFRIESRPYQAALSQAEAQLARDKAQATNLTRDAERYQALAGKDYVTKQQADQAQASAAAQSASVDADRAMVENARFNLDNATIRAPITGRTGGLLVKQGNLVKAAGQTLVVINQIQPILVRFAVPAREFPAIQSYARSASLPVRVTPAATSAASRGDAAVRSPIASSGPIIGTLSFLDNTVDTTTGTVLLKAKFANPTGALWPGEFVRVQLQLFVQQNVIAVPTQALMAGQTGSYVFVIDPSGKAQQRAVVAGRSIDSTTTLVERGLAAGERVVTDGQSRLFAGAKVDIRPAEPAIRPAPTL
ncbi:MAG: efflux RND transporter periplasmic adaptor subunit [Gemmatimonadota bacterium]|nr:efflux RND transporter periplasmic adaptor subunit [Gemmatimonadota bacterium]